MAANIKRHPRAAAMRRKTSSTSSSPSSAATAAAAPSTPHQVGGASAPAALHSQQRNHFQSDANESAKENEDIVHAAALRLRQRILPAAGKAYLASGSTPSSSSASSPTFSMSSFSPAVTTMQLPQVTQPRADIEGFRRATRLSETRPDVHTVASPRSIDRPSTPPPQQSQVTPPPVTPTGKAQGLTQAGEPSLYAAVFGPQVAQQLHAAADAAAPKTPPSDTSSSFGLLRSGPSPSPRIRKGSSAKLHHFCSMPQLGSPERARRGGPPVGIDPHNAPSQAHLEQEDAMAFAHPHQSWVVLSPSRRRSAAGSPSLELNRSLKRRRDAESSTLSPAPVHGSPATPSSSHRSRMASAGYLPNGHPATPLAQGLGLVHSGSRSRQSSINPATPSKVRFSSDIQTSEETDRVAGVLAAMADERVRRQQQSALGTPTKREYSSWADPSSITPRRAKIMKALPSCDSEDGAASAASAALSPSTPPKKLDAWNDDGDRKSASLLLHLANSPSIGQSPVSQERIHDMVPSPSPSMSGVPSNVERRRMSSHGSRVAPILRPTALASRPLYEEDEERDSDADAVADSLLALPASMPASDTNSHESSSGEETAATSGDNEDHTYCRASSHPSRVVNSIEGDGNSPITPPHSNRLKSMRQMEGTIGRSLQFATPPATPSKTDTASGPPPETATRRHGRSRQYSHNPDGTPRTPSPVPSEASNPRTPHTPNTAAFAYSEFVNVSPSPKPRSRGPSGRFTPSLGQFDNVSSWEEAVALHEAEAEEAALLESPRLDEGRWPGPPRRHRTPSSHTMLTPGPAQGPFPTHHTESPSLLGRARQPTSNGVAFSPRSKYAYPVSSTLEGAHRRQPSISSAVPISNPGLGFDI